MMHLISLAFIEKLSSIQPCRSQKPWPSSVNYPPKCKMMLIIVLGSQILKTERKTNRLSLWFVQHMARIDVNKHHLIFVLTRSSSSLSSPPNWNNKFKKTFPIYSWKEARTQRKNINCTTIEFHAYLTHQIEISTNWSLLLSETK